MNRAGPVHQLEHIDRRRARLIQYRRITASVPFESVTFFLFFLFVFVVVVVVVHSAHRTRYLFPSCYLSHVNISAVNRSTQAKISATYASCGSEIVFIALGGVSIT